MRRFAVVGLSVLLLASAVSLLRAQQQDERPPAGGALVFPQAQGAWEYRFVSGPTRTQDDLRRIERATNELGAQGYAYAGPLGDGAVFQRPRR